MTKEEAIKVLRERQTEIQKILILFKKRKPKDLLKELKAISLASSAL